MRISVPFDGSPASVHAVKLAIDQAKLQATHSVVALYVQNLRRQDLPDGAGIMSPNWITEQEKRPGSEVLAESRAICEEASVPYESRVELGGIAATIERVTGEAGIDHIVMGTRGLGGVRGLLLGSVATKVLQLVNVPVTLVK